MSSAARSPIAISQPSGRSAGFAACFRRCVICFSFGAAAPHTTIRLGRPSSIPRTNLRASAPDPANSPGQLLPASCGPVVSHSPVLETGLRPLARVRLSATILWGTPQPTGRGLYPAASAPGPWVPPGRPGFSSRADALLGLGHCNPMQHGPSSSIRRRKGLHARTSEQAESYPIGHLDCTRPAEYRLVRGSPFHRCCALGVSAPAPTSPGEDDDRIPADPRIELAAAAPAGQRPLLMSRTQHLAAFRSRRPAFNPAAWHCRSSVRARNG
jgi:hypothetical protein